ncbi:MAG: SRPBCC family protein [Burkholderiaceae bacterium]
MAFVFVSSVIPAPASTVWATVRDFNDMPAWHPLIAQSRIEHGKASDQIGCVRNFSLTDGSRLRERLLALSDYEFSQTYAILDSHMPLSDYIATLRLHPVTDGDRTFAEWTARFECAPADEHGLVTNIGSNVFQAGFDALKRRFG